jgi:hypothetical protein
MEAFGWLNEGAGPPLLLGYDALAPPPASRVAGAPKEVDFVCDVDLETLVVGAKRV